MVTFGQTPAGNVRPLRPRDHDDGARVAIQWLAERHRKGWRSAFEDLMDLWRPEADAGDWSAVDDDLMQMLTINAGEWLIARGSIRARGGLRPINEYLLSRDGPYLTPGQQRWIAQLRAQPLWLYRVTDVRVEEGLTLVDAIDSSAEPVDVLEISASRSARPGMLMGVRLMRLKDAAQPPFFELSGAIYPFTALNEARVLERVRSVAAGAGALSLNDPNRRDLAETEIARAWIAQWSQPAVMPQILDAATGEAMLLITDHYRVLDAAALAAALAAQSDVSGDATTGWHRDSDAGGGMQRSLAAINPGKSSDLIEIFYRTQGLADTGRAWFEQLAGASVEHLTREIVDPASAAGRVGGKAGPTPKTLPPEVMAQAIEQLMRKHYGNWCDEPVPALDNRTPRQAMATPAGLERVKGLLRMYEDGEREQSTQQGRPAFSFQFLWDELGIER